MTETMKTLDELNFSSDILDNCNKLKSYCDPVMLWNWLLHTQGHRTPLSKYQDETKFREVVELMFIVNEYKYERLFNTTKTDYNPLDTFNNSSEELDVNRQSGTTTSPKGEIKNTQSETSMDSTELRKTGENSTSYENHNIEVKPNNDINDTITINNEKREFKDASSTVRNLKTSSGSVGNHPFPTLMNLERESVNFSLIAVMCADIIELTCLGFITSFE